MILEKLNYYPQHISRPPLANLFAVHDPDLVMLDVIMRDIQSSGEFAEVWRPALGWVAGVAPLPGSSPDGALARKYGLVFAEGRDRLEEGFGHTLDQRFREIAQMADDKPHHLASLPGDFGFIRFRASGGATVVRSCGGLVPFYLWHSGQRFAISTQLGNFVRYLPDEPRLDPLANAVWACLWPTFLDGRTPLAGVTLLNRGCFARLKEGRQILTGRYWNPRPERLTYPTPAKAREHAQRLRTLLIEKLKRDLDPEDGNLLTLSGGVDSSSLAALAVGVVGRKVWTWTLLPVGEKARQHELSFIEPLVERYGIERRWSVSDDELEELLRQAPRIVFHVLHPALRSLPGILKEASVRVLFGGEYADEVCGHFYTVPDWAAHTSLLRVLTDWRVFLRHPRNLAHWGKHRLAWLLRRPRLRFPRELLEVNLVTRKPLGLFVPEVKQEYQDWWHRRQREVAEDPLPWRYLWADSEEIAAFVLMNWEACSALGIRRSFPFFTREMFELVFECHPSELYGPGVKKLSRAALRGDVPERNLFRQDKGIRDDAYLKSIRSRQKTFSEPVPDELEGILSPEWFSNPPKMVDYWRYACLTRLLLFVERLRARRQERESLRLAGR